MKQQPVCPDCSSHQLKLIGKLPDSNEFSGVTLDYHLLGGNLYSCCLCNLKFRFPVLAQEEYNKLYNTENFNWIFDENRNDWKILKKFVEEKIPENAKVLDFGCNFGDVLAKLPDRLEKYGIEINLQAAEIARQKSDAAIYTGYQFLPAGVHFDLIFAIDVVEHLNSPRKFISDSLSFLKKGGFIALMTGDSDSLFAKLSGSNWYYSTYPEHISFISRKWAEKLCRNSGELEMVLFKNYPGTKKPLLKRVKWFVVWMVNFLLKSKSKQFFGIFPKIQKTGMGQMKNFGKNFSADHLFVVFRKI